jgi:manganese/iron transport system permease protein
VTEILAPFSYDYMVKAMWVAAMVGGVCGFLSAYLTLKGWSLIGDALAHAVVPGVAVAYVLKLPYAIGAFVAAVLAALAMLIVKSGTRLREDAVIGVVFTAFFASGLLIVSLNPTSVNVQSIVLGNILGISDADARQVLAISFVTLVVLAMKWRDLMVVFFDEAHARAIGLRPLAMKTLFFALLAGMTVAALQTVGAALVIAMVITPGATGYLLTDRFERMILLAMGIGATTGGLGAYLSFFLDGATGGVIVCLQTLVFLTAFVFAPKHGLLAQRRRARTVAP